MSAIIELSSTVRARIAILVLLAFGCGPVVFVSRYDEVLDQGISEIHMKLAAFVASTSLVAGTPDGTYEARKAFYPEIASELATLRLRAHSQSKNEITEKLVDELKTNVENLRKLHEAGGAGGLPPAAAGPAMTFIDTNCSAIMAFELAKKRGEETRNN